jgi:hypothetical protein
MAMTVWRTGAWRLQIVKRSDAAGFKVLPNDGLSRGRSRGSVANALLVGLIMMGSQFKFKIISPGLPCSPFDKSIEVYRATQFSRPLSAEDIEVFNQGDDVIPLIFGQRLIRDFVALKRELAGSQADSAGIVPLRRLHDKISWHRPRQFCDICCVSNSMRRGLTPVLSFVSDHYRDQPAFFIGGDMHSITGAKDISAQLTLGARPHDQYGRDKNAKLQKTNDDSNRGDLVAQSPTIAGFFLCLFGLMNIDARRRLIGSVLFNAGLFLGFFCFLIWWSRW